MNMLADERQRAFKSNKSTIDVIYNIKRNLIKKQRNGVILPDLSRAFDRIDRENYGTSYTEKGYP